MFRLFLPAALLTLLATAAPADCPDDAHAQVEAATRSAEAGETPLDALNPLATRLVNACPDARALHGHILAMFTRAGLASEPPDRFAAHGNAFRTAGLVLKAGGGGFAGADYGEAARFTPLDERNAWFDLMLAMSTDFLVYGAHDTLYAPGSAERFGCGLYPAEEAAALAAQGEGNADGGELLVRVSFLGRNCDTESGEVAGQAARYFAAHAEARADDPDYLGLTASDIRAGLQRFLPAHLGGKASSALFSAAEVTRLLAF